MKTWRIFNNELNNIKSVIRYKEKIEKQVQKLLNEIFDVELDKEKGNINRFFYDFVIYLKGFTLYCEIKFENTSLKRYWDEIVLNISEEIKGKRSSHRYGKLKYLLILIDSHDSIAKMDLDPIYPNIIVINLKMLFEISNYIKRDQMYSKLIPKLFKFASGIFYDSIIKDFLGIMQYAKIKDYTSKLQDLYINRDILNVDMDNLIKESKNIEKQIESEKISELINFELEHDKEVTSGEIMEFLNLNREESEYYLHLKTKEERRLEQLSESILKKIKIPSLNILIEEFNLKSQEANELGNYMLKKGYIKDFPEYILTITLLYPPLQPYSSFYETYVMNHLNQYKFRLLEIYDYLEDKKFEKILSFSEIILIDVTIFNPEIYFFLGLIKNYQKEIVIMCQKLFTIPKFLSSYKIFRYDLNDYDTIKIDLVNYIKKIREKFSYKKKFIGNLNFY